MSQLKNYALSAYPISQSMQNNLMAKTGEIIHFFQLAEIRQKNLQSNLIFLLNLKVNHFFLVLEDPCSETLLPILQIVAKFALPKQITVVDSQMRLRKINFKEIFFSGIRFVKTSIYNQYIYHLSMKQMKKMFNQETVACYTAFKSAKDILYLNSNLWFGVKAGGSVGHIAGVVNALVKKGIQVEYAAVDKSSQVTSKIIFHQLPLIKAFGIPAELNYFHFNKLVVHDLLKKNKHWDFIYQRLSIANFAGVKLSLDLNIPLIIEYNGSEAWIAKNWGKALRYHEAAVLAEQVCLKHAQKIVTISDVLVKELLERGVPERKIVFYPNCIDPEIFDPDLYNHETCIELRKEYKIPENALVYTFVGTFGQWHGVEFLAKVIRQLIEKNEDWLLENKIHFLLVGDGVKMEEVKNILGDKITKNYLTLTGLVPQALAPAFLAASDVLLSPHVANQDGSRFFGSPTKLFEYMAMAKPIIASDLEQIGNVLKNSFHIKNLNFEQPPKASSELAILCQPGNIEDLLKAIMVIARQESWRKILGINARREALEKYTWDKHIEAFL